MDHWDLNSLQAENVRPQSFNYEFYGTEHARAYNETNFLSMETQNIGYGMKILICEPHP